mgnify:CR=1 FL=1
MRLELEIDNFKTQLAEVDGKERDINKNVFAGHSSNAQRQELINANNALRTDIHKKLILREKQMYEVQQQYHQARDNLQNNKDVEKMYNSI